MEEDRVKERVRGMGDGEKGCRGRGRLTKKAMNTS